MAIILSVSSRRGISYLAVVNVDHSGRVVGWIVYVSNIIDSARGWPGYILAGNADALLI